MNYLKRCPQCGATLRIPATQSLLLVRCPVCSHSFRFDASQEDSETTPETLLEGKEPFYQLLLDLLYAPIDYWKYKSEAKSRAIKQDSKNESIAKRISLFLLFSILSLTVFRGCEESKLSLPDSQIQESQPIPPPSLLPPEEEEKAPHGFDI